MFSFVEKNITLKRSLSLPKSTDGYIRSQHSSLVFKHKSLFLSAIKSLRAIWRTPLLISSELYNGTSLCGGPLRLHQYGLLE